MLSRELARGDHQDALAPKPVDEVAEPELVERPSGVDQHVGLGSCAAEDVDLVQQRRVLHDQRVRLDDRLA